MATEEESAHRTIATVVATAAVTLSIGVTAAALGGYLVPAGKGGGTTPEQATESSAVELPRAAAPPDGPSVVLVPVAPDSPTVSATPHEVLLAAYEPTDHDEGHHGKHRARDQEDEHDDDD